MAIGSSANYPAAGLLALVAVTACTTMDGVGINGNPPMADAGEPPSTCPSPVVRDAQTKERGACTFLAGDEPIATLGIGKAVKARIPIDHVIVLMKENRSYDHIFGHLSDVDPKKYEGIPDTFSNPDDSGNAVKPFHADTLAIPTDPAHQWDEMHAQVNGGKMDGFVKSAKQSNPSTDGHFAMSYYDESDLPFYYFLAKTFALADRHFPSALTGTWPNRDYLYAGTSDGVRFTQGLCDPTAHGCIPHVPFIFDALDEAPAPDGGQGGVPWGVYTTGAPSAGAPLGFALEWGPSHVGVHSVDDLISELEAGSLPNVAFVDGAINTEDDHPPADLKVGERWLKRIYDAAVKSPLWPKMALIFTYDEAGGFFDHVPPPPYDAGESKVCVARPEDSDFFELGIRVPLVVISQWARRGYVSHIRHEHTSITRLIELLFDLPALTARDANSDALLDMFDFECRGGEPPAAPDIGN